MNRPCIFVSAVSRELGTARRQVAATLHTLGYDTVSQDDFSTGHGELKEWLRQQVERCEGVLQLVGETYGAEPPTPDSDFGRVSYTQWEFLHGQKLGKKTWVILAQPGFSRDTPAEKLDLPEDSRHADPPAYQAERRRLQWAYVQRLIAENHLRHQASSSVDLQNIVLKLRDDLGLLRRRTEGVQRRLLAGLAAVLVGLAVLAGGGWWAYQRLGQTVRQVEQHVQDAAKVDAAKIRGHLIEASDQAHQRDLAAADQLPGWQERQEAREAAEAAHQARLKRVAALADEIADVEGRGNATAVTAELRRVLAGEGVDAALAFVAAQRGAIVSRVRERAALAHERNRAELRPLLTAAGLEATSGRLAAARAAYEEIVLLEPDWPDALADYGWFLYDQAIQAKTHGALAAAVTDAARMLALAARLPPADRLPYEQARVLPAALEQSGDVLLLRGKAGDAEQALAHYQRGLEIRERLLAANPGSAQASRDVSVSLEKLGNFLAARGSPGDAEQALAHYQRGLEIRERLLAANPGSAQASRDVSVSLEKLGNFLAARGSPGDAEQALAHYQRGLEISERLLAANPDSAQAARDVSVSLEKLGDILAARGSPGDAEQALAHYQRGLEIRERLLAANPGSAQAARDVSVSLNTLGDFLAARGSPGDAEQALAHYQRGLEIRERLLAANPGSAQAARDVSVSLNTLGDFLAARGSPGDAEQALAHYQRGLEISERLLAANPDSAQAARDVSVSLEKLGDILAARGSPGDAEQALAHYQRGLEISERLLAANPGSAQAARDVSVSLNTLGDFLAARGSPGDAEQALAHYQRGLEIRERLLAANPDSAQAARDVSISLNTLGDFLAARGSPGDAEQALAHYQRCHETLERLLAANPDSAQAARDVSVSLNKLGDFLAARGSPGDAEQALAHYQRGLEISERLLAANPDSAQAARDVWVSCWKMARLAEQAGKDDAQKWWKKAFEILDGMQRAGRFLSKEDEGFLKQLRAKAQGPAESSQK